MFGFRSALTLSSEEAWNRVNAFSAIVLTASAVVGYALILVFIEKMWSGLLFTVLFLGLVACVIQHVIVRRDMPRNNKRKERNACTSRSFLYEK